MEESDRIHQTHALWSLCVSAPDVSCVAGDTQREALREAGIIFSDKLKLKV